MRRLGVAAGLRRAGIGCRRLGCYNGHYHKSTGGSSEAPGAATWPVCGRSWSRMVCRHATYDFRNIRLQVHTMGCIMPGGVGVSEQMKRCTTCGRDLPLSDFYADRRQRLGKMSACKSCVRAERKAKRAQRRAADNARRARDPERARRKDAEYYAAHREARNEAQRRYRAKRHKGQGDA